MQTKESGGSSPNAGRTASGEAIRITVPDEATFSMEKVTRITHNFHLHPLMQLDALQALANRLMPTGQCKFIKPGATFTQGFHLDGKPLDRRDVDDVFARIEEPKSWIALYNVETDPLYAGLLHDAVGTVRHLVEREEPGVFLMTGFIFISAPPSVTPFHIDRENNFWLQIRGRKTINVWNPGDRVMVSQGDVESFIAYRSLENVKLRDESLTSRSLELNAVPGDGVYFPSTSPHATRSMPDWTTPGDGVAISIGITFYTSVTRKRAHLHFLNDLLRRKLGMNPSPPGMSSFDALKEPIAVAVIGAKKSRGWEPPAGF